MLTTPAHPLAPFVALASLKLRLRTDTAARVARAPDPAALLGRGSGALEAVGPLRAGEAEALASFDAWGWVDREIERADRAGVVLVPLGHADYPARLASLLDPPPLLYVRGDLGPPGAPAVAMVGSRAASAYGRAVARAFATHLGRAGVTVVSGFARGIDAQAHEGALASGRPTVAVLGCGIDVPYPRANDRLRDRIAEQGALVTEFPFGVTPRAEHFPMRNRVVSGLSQAVIVVEAASRSGSLITARAALEQGRDVFAIPGAIDSPGAVGAHALIREGAILASDPAHVLEELGIEPPAAKEPAGDDGGPLARVRAALGASPAAVEDIRERSGLAASEVAMALLELELNGEARRLSGGGYVAASPFGG